MRQELTGQSIESFQLALKKQVESDEKKEGTIEKNFRFALSTLNSALAVLEGAIRQIQDI
jgi:hypothetical protein